MNANQIVKALRTVVHIIGACDDNLVVTAIKGHMTAAADLIESLQAQFVAKDAEIARLTEALHKADIDCDNCKHNHGGDCENHDFDCGTCEYDCPCKLCDGTNKWEWRGAKANNQGGKP